MWIKFVLKIKILLFNLYRLNLYRKFAALKHVYWQTVLTLFQSKFQILPILFLNALSYQLGLLTYLDCKDTGSTCYSDKKHCNDSDPGWKNYMVNNCKKTCGLCGGVKPGNTIVFGLNNILIRMLRFVE